MPCVICFSCVSSFASFLQYTSRHVWPLAGTAFLNCFRHNFLQPLSNSSRSCCHEGDRHQWRSTLRHPATHTRTHTHSGCPSVSLKLPKMPTTKTLTFTHIGGMIAQQCWPQYDHTHITLTNPLTSHIILTTTHITHHPHNPHSHHTSPSHLTLT